MEAAQIGTLRQPHLVRRDSNKLPRSSSQVRRSKRLSSTTVAQIDAAPVGIEAATAGSASRRARRRRRTAQIGIPAPRRRAKSLRQHHLVRPVSNPPDHNWVVRRARSPRNWRDWSDLGDGPAGLIAERVLAYDVADYVRFRAVCRPWRQSSTEPRSHSGLDRRFHPCRWTMLREELAAPDRRSFLNTSTGQCVQVDIPELRDHELLALTPEGLLVLLHKQQLTTIRLLNPLTRNLTELPSLTTLLPSKDHKIILDHGISVNTYFSAWGSGIASDDSTFVLCFNWHGMLGMAKPGDNHWTVVNYNHHGITTAPLMFAGRFYCVNLNLSGLMVLEMGADQPPQLKKVAGWRLPIVDSMHLVNNCGELMLVHRRCGLPTARNKSGWGYNVYRVDFDTGTLSASSVKSLGGSAGRAVFMGMYCSLSVSLECFPSGSISADTIYFSFDIDERRRFEVGAYHLIDGSIELTSRNPGGLVPRPHTLADCLCLSQSVVEVITCVW